MNDAWKKFKGITRDIIEKNIPNHKGTNKRRSWVTREFQQGKAKNKAWKKFRTLKDEVKNGLSCENEARLENLNRNYVKKRNNCNDANRVAIKNFEQKLSRNLKEDSKSVTRTAFPYHTLHRQPIPITGIAQTVRCSVYDDEQFSR